jgi:polysaccharide biosynthesis protein PslH
MRALIVAPYLPTHGSGGRTRLVNFMERLSRHHDLHLVAFAAPDQQSSDSPYPGTVLSPPPLRHRPGGLRGVLRFYGERLVDGRPSFVSWISSDEMRAAVVRACESFRPDIVHIETTEMGQYLHDVPAGVPTALDLQDVASRWFGRVRSQGQTRQQRTMMAVELLKTRRYETRCARRADVVFVTSEIEKAFLDALTGVSSVEVPNGVDTAAFVPRPDAVEDADTILFVGPLSYSANLDGMQWFAREVLPLITAAHPQAHVDLVGAPIDEHGLPPAVHLLGRVPDVRDHLARAPLSIVPVRVGSGTRYKILEALSMGRAVVSTTVGAEGLGVVDREHLLLADDPQPFAAAVLELLSDAALRTSLGEAGRAHVLPRFDWEPLVAAVDAGWERAVAAKR